MLRSICENGASMPMSASVSRSPTMNRDVARCLSSTADALWSPRSAQACTGGVTRLGRPTGVSEYVARAHL